MIFLVANPRVELGSRAYETREVPFLQSASFNVIYFLL